MFQMIYTLAQMYEQEGDVAWIRVTFKVSDNPGERIMQDYERLPFCL